MTCLLNESISTLTSPCRSLDLAILIRERHCSISLATLRASKRSSFLILSFMNVDTISSLRRFDSSSSAILRSRYFTCKVCFYHDITWKINFILCYLFTFSYLNYFFRRNQNLVNKTIIP